MNLFTCVVLVFSVFGIAAGQECNSEIVDNNDFFKNSTVYVDSEGGGDDKTGSSGAALKTIEQVKKCFGHNTTMNLAPGTYKLTPPANMSQSYNEDFFPFFTVVGASQGTSIIVVEAKDFQDLHIHDVDGSNQVLYVYQARFDFSNVIVQVDSTPPDKSHSSLVWMHMDSVVTFDKTKFTGTDTSFPKHLFIHTGGDLTLKNVEISSTNHILTANVIFWFGTSTGAHHTGSWTLDHVTLGNVDYIHGDSLFEQGGPDYTLAVDLTNSMFNNITWTTGRTATSAKRRSNANPIGLIFTVRAANNGKVSIKGTTFKELNVSTVDSAAPLAVVSLPDILDPLVLDTVIFSGNVGNSAGSIASNADKPVKIRGKSTFENNVVVVDGGSPIRNDYGTTGDSKPNFDESEDVSGSVAGAGVVVNKEGNDDKPNELPKWALPVIIIVAIVVVAAVVVVIVAGVYFRKKKYAQLADDADEYNESSSSSHRSGDKDNEMDSI